MYSYFYDDFVADKKYERTLTAVENRLTDLGIQGRIDRFAPFRSPKEMLADAVRKGAKTIVAVGNDDTARKVIDVWPDFEAVLGIIPIAEPCALSSFLGIPLGEAACDILSARLIEKLDLGKVNNHYFLSHLNIPSEPVSIECDRKFVVTPVGGGKVRVCNFSIANSQYDAGLGEISSGCDPRDGVLDLLVTSGDKKFLDGLKSIFGFKRLSQDVSQFPTKHLVIRSEKPIAVLSDGGQIEDTQFEVDVAPQKLKVITGSDRRF